ncbi:hypothetical protein SKAU_G00009630 [Synaphobranchus kaupii]|uniref:Uncharacterized protein n=1 Tax=Synaphobranchus kaupii TaxID=118154 RepID=A0A9Q1GAT3_SYNKA|nr:hypothetical protein SKAU_G00009630 [Synaphobranchus kaupii]
MSSSGLGWFLLLRQPVIQSSQAGGLSPKHSSTPQFPMTPCSPGNLLVLAASRAKHSRYCFDSPGAPLAERGQHL